MNKKRLQNIELGPTGVTPVFEEEPETKEVHLPTKTIRSDVTNNDYVRKPNWLFKSDGSLRGAWVAFFAMLNVIAIYWVGAFVPIVSDGLDKWGSQFVGFIATIEGIYLLGKGVEGVTKTYTSSRDRSGGD